MPVLEIYWSTGENILKYYWSILNNYGILKKSPLSFHANRVEMGKDNSSSDDHFKSSKAGRCITRHITIHFSQCLILSLSS